MATKRHNFREHSLVSQKKIVDLASAITIDDFPGLYESAHVAAVFINLSVSAKRSVTLCLISYKFSKPVP